MRNLIRSALVTTLFLSAIVGFSQTNGVPATTTTDSSLANLQTILNACSPLVAIFVTWLVGKFWGQIPSVLMPLIATAVSTGLAYLGSMAINSSQSFWVSLGVGLAAVTLREILNQVTKATVAVANKQPISRVAG